MIIVKKTIYNYLECAGAVLRTTDIESEWWGIEADVLHADLDYKLDLRPEIGHLIVATEVGPRRVSIREKLFSGEVQ